MLGYRREIDFTSIEGLAITIAKVWITLDTTGAPITGWGRIISHSAALAAPTAMVDRARFVISGGVPTREALRVHALDFVLVSY